MALTATTAHVRETDVNSRGAIDHTQEPGTYYHPRCHRYQYAYRMILDECNRVHGLTLHVCPCCLTGRSLLLWRDIGFRVEWCPLVYVLTIWACTLLLVAFRPAPWAF